MTESERFENMCEDINFYTFGTMKIFNNKEVFYSRLITMHLVISFLTPIFYFSLYVFGNGNTKPLGGDLFFLASLVTIMQFISSIVSLIFKWDDKKVNSKIAHMKNLEINQKAKDIINMKDFLGQKNEIIYLKDLYNMQEQSDNHVSEITDHDKKIAMSHTLYNFGLECYTCRLKPERKKPYRFGNICETCGQKTKRESYHDWGRR